MYLEIDGARLFAEWRRAPVAGRPALVFLHDGLGSAETWRGFPDLLADALGLGAFHYDRWGYGRSDPRDPWPDGFVEEASARLPRLLDAADISDCVLVGHSDGATIGLQYASTAPARVRAVVSIAAHVVRDERAYSEVVRFGDLARDGDLPDWLTRFQGARARQVLTAWTGAWRRRLEAGWEMATQMSGIRAPLLAILGDEDSYTHPLQLEAIAAAVPHVETMLLGGVGHFPHIEDPAGIADSCADFIRRAGI